MSKTITLSDSAYAELAAIFAPPLVLSTAPVTGAPPAVVTPTGSISAPIVLGGGFTGTTRTGSLGGLGAAAPAPQPPLQLAPVIGYPTALVSLADAMFLGKMDITYRHLVPGGELFFDILTYNGRTRAQLGAPGSAAYAAMSQRVNSIINWAEEDNAAAYNSFSVVDYTGPLKPIYAALVQAKRG